MVAPQWSNDANDSYDFAMVVLNENGGTAGTTIPINWNTNAVPTTDPACNSANAQAPKSPLGCRFSLAAKGFKSKHSGGANFLFGDGSVKFLKETIDMGSEDYASRNIGVFRKLSTRAGGEVLGNY